MPRKPNLSIEKKFSGVIAGIDEVGCGPWAGPVVAAAVIFKSRAPRGIDDSKRLPAARRLALHEKIMECAHTAVGIASVEEIDLHNIYQARRLVFLRAIENLGITPDVALVDGNCAPDMGCKVHTVIGGDGLSVTIAAASIVAKVTRDRIMCELAAEFPHYGWERNAGYGTREHRAALAAHGPCPHHRKSFAPIRELLEKMRLAG